MQELATLKKSLEEDTQTHEVLITEMRHKHSQEISEINEQLESLKKVGGFFYAFSNKNTWLQREIGGFTYLL